MHYHHSRTGEAMTINSKLRHPLSTRYLMQLFEAIQFNREGGRGDQSTKTSVTLVP
jgi:hypothetical protein